MIAVGSTLGITTISVLLNPGLWVAWVGFLLDSAGGADPSYRWRVLGAAVVVVGGGALAGVRWLVPIGMALALPVVGGVSALTILAAIPRLVGIASASPATEIENHSEAAR